MTKNKRILNVHEKKFIELENFQANTTVFQTNINATLRNLETQVGQLAVSLQSQSINTFPSSTEINPKDLTPTAMRGNDELQGRKKIAVIRNGYEVLEKKNAPILQRNSNYK